MRWEKVIQKKDRITNREKVLNMIKGLSKDVDLNSVILENPTLQYILSKTGSGND